VGNGNIDVGSATATRKSGSNGPEMRIDPSVKTERQGKIPASSAHAASVSGAMSQQGGEFRGNVSAPQQFVHLVGCRNRKVAPGPEARQYSNPLKR
jgi:hypothetical protein